MILEEVTQRESLPCPIGLQRLVCYGDYGLYLIGGATYTGSMSAASSSKDVYNAQMYKFNVSTRRWTRMAPVAPTFSDERAAVANVKRRVDSSKLVLVSRCAAFLDRRRLMIAGGRLLSSDFNVSSYSTYVYDVDTETTTEVSNSTACENSVAPHLPNGHRDFFDQTLLKWNESLIMVSRVMDDRTGRKRFLFHFMVRHETPDGQSTIGWDDFSPRVVDGVHADEPLAGDLCELALYEDFVYCVDKNDVENCLDVQWRYDLRTRRWENVESVPDLSVGVSSSMFARGKPVDRMFTSCVVHGDSFYVVGGSAMTWAGPKSNPVLADIWRFCMPTQQWSLMPVRMPQGLWFHSVDVSPSGCMYIFGGFTDLIGRKPTQKLWRVYLDASPSLSLLSWHAVLKIGDWNLEEKKDDELREMRVPLCFVAALRW